MVGYDLTAVLITELHLAGCFKGIDLLYTKPGGGGVVLRNNSFADIKVMMGIKFNQILFRCMVDERGLLRQLGHLLCG